jgi:hypothetical protein
MESDAEYVKRQTALGSKWGLQEDEVLPPKATKAPPSYVQETSSCAVM